MNRFWLVDESVRKVIPNFVGGGCCVVGGTEKGYAKMPGTKPGREGTLLGLGPGKNVEIVATGTISVVDGNTPSGSDGFVMPAPVRNTVTTEPRAAGFVSLLGVASEFCAFASPVPEPSAASSPSPLGATLRFKTFDCAPSIVT